VHSQEEQEDFLAHGRFGDGERVEFNLLVKIGLAFLAMGCVCLGFIALMGPLGMRDGRLFLMGLMALCSVAGVLFCLCGLALGPVKKRER
jgi:hypothetical protein